MTYQIVLIPAAERQRRKLPPEMRSRIKKALISLGENPRQPGAKKMGGYQGRWRLRVGTYRIIYSIQDEIVTVRVIRIAHRREVYRWKHSNLGN